MADSSPISAGASAPRSLSEWERITRELLEEGQNFLAHDTAREGLRQYPDSFKLAIFGAVALSQTGAVDEARKLLQPVLDVILIDEGPFHRLHNSLRRAVEGLDEADSQDTLASMAELAEALELVRGKKLVASADAETYTALAGVFREAWLASGSRGDLEHCRELFLRAFHISGAPRDGIDAAVTSWLLGDHDGARELARRVRDRVSHAETDLSLSPEERYQMLATVAEAHLLLGEVQDALASFAWASTLEGIHYGSTVAALKQLALLQEGGLSVPAAVFDIIKPPTVVVFTGHALDRPGEGPHFPPELESAVRAEIAKSLDELGAQVGYSTAACGSDLLFIEAMLERGAEVNVVMPYAIDDFIAENVRYGGSRWEMRFRNALKLANTVTYATEERFLGHGMLYRFANQCLHGLATLRANFLRTAPYLLAVWDMMPGSLAGGAADFIDQWEDISQLRIIDLDGLLQQHPELAGDAMPMMPDLDGEADEEQGEGRVIRSMMFCDIAGYSKLKEEHTPVFLDFLRLISEGMAGLEHQPLAINTWGDAIFAVMDKATPMAEYAQTLQEMVLKADEELADRLPHPLSLRISLHAGPVFQAIDPICGRQNFYGSHINRAARLEPVTVIGHVYATQQFVAVLTAEQSAMRSEAQNRGEDFVERFACEYVGVLSLAKDFGKQTVYHMRRRVTPEAMEPEAAEPPLPPPEPNPQAMLSTELLAVLRDIPAEEGGTSPPEEPFVTEEEPFVAEEEPFAAEEEPVAVEEEASPPAVAEGAISDDDLAAILAMGDVEELGDDEEPAPCAPADLGDLGSPILSDDDMAALLGEAAPPLSEGTLSDDDLAAILAMGEVEELGDDEEPAPCAPADLGDLASTILSDDDMAALLDEALPLDETGEPEPPLSEGTIPDDDLAAILAMGEVEELADDEEPAPCAPADLGDLGSTILSEEDMVALLEEAAPLDDAAEPETSGGTLSDEDLAAILAMGDVEEEEKGEMPAEAADLTSTTLSDADLSTLLAEATEEEEFNAQLAADESVPKPDFSFRTAMSDDEIAALLEESEDEEAIPAGDLPEIGSSTGFSDADLAALSQQAEPCAPDGPPHSPFDLGGAMSDDEIAALLEEGERGEDFAPAGDLPEIGSATGFSDDDMQALLAEAGEAPAESSDDDLAEVAAAVEAAMAKMEAEEDGIALAPPRPKPVVRPFTGKVEISLAPPRK
ncbi:Putative adenylate cyclase (Partial) [Magnetospirillum sp. XM-1]|uniref:adenylate/guanylate cyclase domain-containing protein n=1 Tax=Magnetospirillum sp. XM-1 TaxID=1663591 RepID=UPI00073DFB3F|nr:adenylate/guanylate cyclase domain-containing protein [Magnetospirillum sp. XM-1]CUW41268.1 Putative adenylate cyclase (Partial) [Magnetospirillum sp. XM-1]